MDHPLASFPIVSTRDVEEARSVLSRELTEVRVKSVRDRRAFRLEMNGVHLGRTTLGYNQFGTDTEVDPGQMGSAFVLLAGVGTPSVIEIDGEPVICAEKGAVVSPSRRVDIRRPAGGGLLLIRAGADAIQERCRELLDRRPARSIVFDRSVDLTNGVGAQVRRLLEPLVAEIQRSPAIVANPLLRAGLDDMFVNALLALPSNFTEALTGDRAPSAAPGIVRRAEEYMEAHCMEPITISTLVAECGCGGTVLHGAFRRYRGYTPMQFLADCRLKAAREALLAPSPTDTVSSIAFACGFPHLGRFSGSYRTRFGERPSETLRRSR